MTSSNTTRTEYIKGRGMNSIDFVAISTAMISSTADSYKVARFRIEHCKRVGLFMKRLAKAGSYKVDARKLTACGAMHDIFKYVNSERHGELGGKFLQEFFVNQGIGDSEWEMVATGISEHSSKGTPSNIYSKLLMDSDVLDHISVSYIRSLYNIFYHDQYTIPQLALRNLERFKEYKGHTRGFKSYRNKLIYDLGEIPEMRSYKDELSKYVQN